MLRLAVAFGALVLAVSLVSPTLANVGQAVEDLELRREMPWQIWKRDNEVRPPETTCNRDPLITESEVTKWPNRIRKDEPFVLGGHVIVPSQNGRGVSGAQVDLFLNETKELPGVFLGTAVTDAFGNFTLESQIPFELQATRYHLVAHSHRLRIDCDLFEEHWSDPEMEVTSDTNLSLEAPKRAVAGREYMIEGQMLDIVGAPVTNQRLTLVAGGQRQDVFTDNEGRYAWPWIPDQPGNVTVEARFPGTPHYAASDNSTVVRVTGEDVRFDGLADNSTTLEADRGGATRLAGIIVLPPEAPGGRNATLRFSDLNVVPCEGCEPTREVIVVPGPDGRFEAAFTVPSGEAAGVHAFTVSGGGLEDSYEFNLHVFVPTRIELELESAGAEEQAFRGRARLVDDRGEPLAQPMGLLTPTGFVPLAASAADADGAIPFSAEAPCGRQSAQVIFNGTTDTRPAVAQDTVLVCPLTAALTPFGLPLWAWLAGVAALTLLAYVGYRAWRDRTPDIRRGPPLALRFAEDDLAPGIAGCNEPVNLEAKLEAPLPEGYTLRLGTQGNMTAVPVGADLAARHTLVPAHLGRLAVRGEIVDAKGRVVTRRTEFLRVVRYAEEIEARYRALQAAGLGELADTVSPREFEAWLRRNAQDLEPEVARRLVAIFEEADYGPREVGRRELLGFLLAERRLGGTQGVGRPVR